MNFENNINLKITQGQSNLSLLIVLHRVLKMLDKYWSKVIMIKRVI